jgi:hypothetical protein
MVKKRRGRGGEDNKKPNRKKRENAIKNGNTNNS